jgi:hypothetical protein
MTVSWLVDNDIVIKLARMDAFAVGLAGIGATAGSFASLRVMLRYMGVSDEQRRLGLTDGNKAEADRLAVALHSITETELTAEEVAITAAAMKVALTNDLDLDEGELMLMVAAMSRGGLDVASGDKRAIRSLPGLEAKWPKIAGLRDHIVCLEQLFDRLATQHGLARVRKAVTTSPGADATITFVYEQTNSGGVKQFQQGLDFVIEHQIRRPAPGWLKPL